MADWRDDIEKYKRGELSPKEMHDLEKRALSDPFLADALEGIASISSEEFSADLAQINQAIQPKKFVFTPLRIAAGIVVLIGVSLFAFWPSEKTEQIAEQQVHTSSDTIKTEPPPKEQLTLAEETKKPKKVEAEKENTATTTTTPEAASTKSDTTLVSEELVTRDLATAPLLAKESTTNKISGIVTMSEDGLPLPGVTIQVKGTNLGTTTDLNGHYTLNAPDSTTLVFSFVGRQTSEVTPGNKSTVDVKLNEDVSQLSEVVITRPAPPRPAGDEPVIVLAEPVGGIKAYDKYMEDNLRYPEQALEANVKGRVVVEFNVGINGSLGDFSVRRSLGYGCDEEVIRLVKEGPAWRPTTEDDKPVESFVRVRMKFDPAKAKKKR